MTVTFRTAVWDLPPTPLGLLPRRLVVEHRCDSCGEKVGHDHLVEHALAHGAGPTGQGGDVIE